MGNYRFRLSDMIPNAWFYKLKDMSAKPKPRHRPTTRSRNKISFHFQSSSTSPLPSPRQSYYFSSGTREKILSSDTLFPDSPRKPKKKSPRKRSLMAPSSAAAPAGSGGLFDTTESRSSSGSCRLTSSSGDLVLDMESKACFELDLPPILTKPRHADDDLFLELTQRRDTRMLQKPKSSTPGTKTERSPARRSSSSSPAAGHGLRLRTSMNSPRLASRKIQAHQRRAPPAASRRSLLESFAVVKSSFDPQRDFRDSMVEMIVENNIRASKDLEELLACYLSLNADEYHDLIVKVFQQIWFDLRDIRL